MIFNKNKKLIADAKNGGPLSDTNGSENKIGEFLSFESAEAYKLLRTNITFSFADEKECKVIGITSSLHGEGKSLVCINTAFTLAQTNKRVLVIDGDLRLPTVADKLGIKMENGLTNLLVGKVENVNQIITRYASSDGSVSFSVAPAGNIPPNPSELLGSRRMEKLVNLCMNHYDYVLIDLPPVTAVSDALVVSKLVDGMLVVVRQDYCDQRSLNETIRQLTQVNVKILGLVMNGHRASEFGYYKKYYKKGYGNDYNTSKQ